MGTMTVAGTVILAVPVVWLGLGTAWAAIGASRQDGAAGTAPTCQASPVVTGNPAARLGQMSLPHDRWYVNADETIWAGWDAPRMRSGGTRNQVVWIAPRDADLTVAARRLDGDATPIRTTVAAGGSWMIVSELHFSDAGCWEVTATSGERELTFVTVVEPTPPPVPAISR